MATNNGNHEPNRTIAKETPARWPESPRRKRSGFLWLVLPILILAACAVAFVFSNRAAAGADLASATAKMAVPTVLVIHPAIGDAQAHLILPGTVQAFKESAVYAQVSGYIKRWLVDIGTPVKEGQLLAEIETPVLDQQLKQAQDSVAQTQANLKLAQTTADRYNELLKSNAVSQQDVDTQNAGLQVQKANLAAAEANLNGLQQSEAFKQVRAPFDGVVTTRKIDVGDYVSATGQTASSGTAPITGGVPNEELFRVAQITTLRVYVNVPENYAGDIVPGIGAMLEFASTPTKKVTGTLVRTSDAIDPNSLTLLAEVDVPNPDGKLLSGGYAQVHFDIKTDHPPLLIPGNTLIFRSQGPQVGVVDDSNTVHLQNITIGRDFGSKLEVTTGLKPEDTVILNPSDSLVDGTKVQLAANQQPKTP